jgi:hypothetical protein
MEARLAALGTPKEVRDRVLNHAQTDVGSKHYNLYEYVAEKRAALMRFESALAAILTGETAAVVSLADRRAAS